MQWFNKEVEFGVKVKVELTGQSANIHQINRTLLDLQIPHKLPDDFDVSTAAVNKDKYGLSGTLNKRISKYMYKHNQYKMTEVQLSQLSDKLARYSIKGESYLVEFRADFDWKDGYFKDPYSCWFTFNKFAPQLIKDLGGFFVCFYDLSNKPVGRCVVFPDPKNKENWMLINSKGIHMKGAADSVSMITGQPNKRYNLDNEPKKLSPIRRILYFDGDEVYFIGDKVEELGKLPDNYIQIDELGYGGKQCNRCGHYYRELEVCSCQKK